MGAFRQVSKRAVRRAGFSVLEVTIALLIVSTVLVSLTGSFLSSAEAVHKAQGTNRATVFLQSVMEDLSAQPFDALLSFNGNRVFDHDTQLHSNWSVDLSVFPVGVDLEQVDATLTDLRSARILTRVTTLRSRR